MLNELNHSSINDIYRRFFLHGNRNLYTFASSSEKMAELKSKYARKLMIEAEKIV